MKHTSDNCAILIPVYKPHLTPNEEASLKQVLSILPNYKFFFVCSESFELKSYLSITALFDTVEYRVERFSSNNFSSLAGYSKLLLSANFYKRFIGFNFILIYQLDAWVFQNKLDYWCERGFDYIGAPWFEGFDESRDDDDFLGVGNGGFSLRKVKSHLKVLTSLSYLTSPKKIFYERLKKVQGVSSLIRQAAGFLGDLTIKNNTYHLFNNYLPNEDFFWGDLVPSKFNWFKVADIDTAIQFSFECNPRKLFKLNNFEVPFGCHAWEKYDPDFWKDFIKIDTNNQVKKEQQS